MVSSNQNKCCMISHIPIMATRSIELNILETSARDAYRTGSIWNQSESGLIGFQLNWISCWMKIDPKPIYSRPVESVLIIYLIFDYLCFINNFAIYTGIGKKKTLFQQCCNLIQFDFSFDLGYIIIR